MSNSMPTPDDAGMTPRLLHRLADWVRDVPTVVGVLYYILR